MVAVCHRKQFGSPKDSLVMKSLAATVAAAIGFLAHCSGGRCSNLIDYCFMTWARMNCCLKVKYCSVSQQLAYCFTDR